jgi:protein-S-isoprenylcysteine O-methyltransferase Ste14
MSIKVRRLHYRGSRWVPLFWTIVFFPVAILLFALNAILTEEEITRPELDQLLK